MEGGTGQNYSELCRSYAISNKYIDQERTLKRNIGTRNISLIYTQEAGDGGVSKL